VELTPQPVAVSLRKELATKELQHERCGGMDISKRDAKVCVRTPGKRFGTFDKTVTVWGSTSREVSRLHQFLLNEHVSVVVMEATGAYWKPYYYPMESDLNLMLVNARYARNLPGRKTDVADAQWLAELGAHGLVRPSFVPPEPIRELRDLTRTRTVSPANAAARSNGWKNCWRTPASSCLRSQRKLLGSPGGQCSPRSSTASTTPYSWRS